MLGTLAEMTNYLTAAWTMFANNPAGYVTAAVNVLILGGVGYGLLYLFGVLMGFNHKGLFIKSEWEFDGRGVVILDPELPGYHPPDRVRVNGVTVYSNFSPGARVEYQAAWEHFKRVYPTSNETEFREGWESNRAYGNPVFRRD